MSAQRVSWSQRHRLGQTRSDAAGGVYNPHHTVAAFRVDGALDERATRAAWHALQLRHPVLCCRFAPDAFQWCVPRRPELSDPETATVAPDASGTVTDEVALAVLTEAAARPFDLAAGRPARLLVIPTDGPRTFIQLTVEHLISDGWSLNVLVRDLAELYTAAVNGGRPRLPPPSRPAFARYVYDQNAMLESDQGRDAIHALAELVADTGPVPGTPIAGFSGRRDIRYDRRDGVARRLDAALCQALAKRARTAGMSAPTLMHAALHDALWRLSGAERVATTLSTANRYDAGADAMAGWLASKVVVASSPGRSPDADHFLAGFHRRVLAGFDLAHVPWPRLIAEMAPWAVGRHAIEPYVTFNAQTAGMLRHLGPVVFDRLPTEPLPVSVGWHDASIATFWKEDADGMRVTVNWKTDWYQEADIERLWTTLCDSLRRWAG